MGLKSELDLPPEVTGRKYKCEYVSFNYVILSKQVCHPRRQRIVTVVCVYIHVMHAISIQTAKDYCAGEEADGLKVQ